MASKKKNPVFRTDTGVAVWPHLNNPDTKFDKPFGVFRVTLRLPIDNPSAKQIIKVAKAGVAKELKLAKEAEESPAKRKRIKEADLPYIETDDGEYIDFNFKHKAGGRRKEEKTIWRWRPALFDPHGTPIDPKKYIIGGGSTLKVAYNIRSWFGPLGAGVSLNLVGAQVIKFVAQGGPVSWESSGFSEEEGEGLESWEKSEVESEDEVEDEDDDPDGSDDDGFGEPDDPDDDPATPADLDNFPEALDDPEDDAF